MGYDSVRCDRVRNSHLTLSAVILTIYVLSIEMWLIRCVPYVPVKWQLGCLRKCRDEQLTNQRQLIISQFGFTPIQTTLLGCVDGVVESAYLVLPLSSPFCVRAPRIPVVAIYTNSGVPYIVCIRC